MTEIYDSLRKAIRASGKTRYRICKDAGVEESALSRFMSDKEDERRGLSVESMERIAKSLGLSITLTKQRGVR